MRLCNVSPVFLLLGLSLAFNKMSPGTRFWNTTTTPSSTFIASTTSSSIDEVAIIQIQIGSLSGSGVINLSNFAPTREVGQLTGSLSPASSTNQSYPAKTYHSHSTFYQPNTAAVFPLWVTSAQISNSTVAISTGRPSARQSPLASQISPSSGSRINVELLQLPAILFLFVIQVAVMSLI